MDCHVPEKRKAPPSLPYFPFLPHFRRNSLEDDFESLWIPMLDDEETKRLANELYIELMITELEREENEKRKATANH